MQIGEKQRLKQFYGDVADSFPRAHKKQKVAFIVVSHVLPDKPTFIESLSKLGRIAAVIPKTSERDSKVFQEMEARFPLHPEITKCSLHNGPDAISFIKQAVNHDEKFIIIDIGGYFAPALKDISHDPDLSSKFLGVVEGTENGHQKYDKVVSLSNHPVFSKARSKLKSPEDYKVGKSIVRAADTMMRHATNLTIEDKPQVGVIGFGKVGRSIALHLQAHNYVTVYDENPVTLAMASAMGFRVANKDKLLAESDMLFLATGNGSMKGNDFKKCKNDVYIASCTSQDDEMDITWLEKNYKEHEECKINTFQSRDGHRVNLMMRGNAVNFYDKGVIGPPIYLAGAEFIADSIMLMNNADVLKTDVIHELDDRHKRTIAEHWLSHYTDYQLQSPMAQRIERRQQDTTPRELG